MKMTLYFATWAKVYQNGDECYTWSGAFKTRAEAENELRKDMAEAVDIANDGMDEDDMIDPSKAFEEAIKNGWDHWAKMYLDVNDMTMYCDVEGQEVEL